MNKKNDFQNFPVEDISIKCYNEKGANAAQDAAEKGAPILCSVPNDADNINLYSLLEDERLFIELLRRKSHKPSINELLIAAEEEQHSLLFFWTGSAKDF